MITFKEFLQQCNMNEAFDILNTTYTKNITYNTALKSLPLYKNVTNMMTYSFKLSGNEYIVVRFFDNNATEFHFMDFTNDLDTTNPGIPKKDAQRVLATVMKVIYDNKNKAGMDNIRIVYEGDRGAHYRKLFGYLRKDYFPEYIISDDKFYKTVKDKDGVDIDQYCIIIKKGSENNRLGGVRDLKEALTKINNI